MNFDRHIGRPVKMECINADGEKDVFYIKPLPFEYMSDYYDLIKSVLNFNKPTFISTGLLDFIEVKSLIKFIKRKGFNFSKLSFVKKTLDI
jgi:hypothetical protein